MHAGGCQAFEIHTSARRCAHSCTPQGGMDIGRARPQRRAVAHCVCEPLYPLCAGLADAVCCPVAPPARGRLLERPDVSIAQAGAQVGYELEAAFNRAFKKFVGIPPGTWRKGRSTLLRPRGRPCSTVTSSRALRRAEVWTDASVTDHRVADGALPGRAGTPRQPVRLKGVPLQPERKFKAVT